MLPRRGLELLLQQRGSEIASANAPSTAIQAIELAASSTLLLKPDVVVAAMQQVSPSVQNVFFFFSLADKRIKMTTLCFIRLVDYDDAIAVGQ